MAAGDRSRYAVRLFQFGRSNPQRRQQPRCDGTIGTGAVDLHRAAVEQQQFAVDLDLVALGMAAEIVVILDDQDARVRLRLAVEVRSGQPADPAADDDQVIGIVDALGMLDPQRAVAKRMRIFEGSGMAAAHTGADRRIIAVRILRFVAPGRDDAARASRRDHAHRCAQPGEQIAPFDALALVAIRSGHRPPPVFREKG